MQSEGFLRDAALWKAEVAIRRVSPVAQRFALPEYQTGGAAGMDLVACIEQPVPLQPGERALIPTGIAIALPTPHLVALVFARSGLAGKQGVHLANGVGVIDSDYRGEIKCALHNSGGEPFVVQPGTRIAQLVVTPVVAVRWREVNELPESGRGTGGFGSTGTRD